MRTLTVKNVPADCKTWIIAYVEKDGSFSYFYSHDDVAHVASVFEWYGSEMVMIHKGGLSED